MPQRMKRCRYPGKFRMSGDVLLKKNGAFAIMVAKIFRRLEIIELGREAFFRGLLDGTYF